MAMEKKIVVITASQLNRELEKEKKDKAPRLDHLKESGGIEEAGDMVLLLQQDDEGEEFNMRDVTVHIRKNRNGPTGQVSFKFDKARTKFFEM